MTIKTTINKSLVQAVPGQPTVETSPGLEYNTNASNCISVSGDEVTAYLQENGTTGEIITVKMEPLGPVYNEFYFFVQLANGEDIPPEDLSYIRIFNFEGTQLDATVENIPGYYIAYYRVTIEVNDRDNLHGYWVDVMSSKSEAIPTQYPLLYKEEDFRKSVNLITFGTYFLLVNFYRATNETIGNIEYPTLTEEQNLYIIDGLSDPAAADPVTGIPAFNNSLGIGHIAASGGNLYIGRDCDVQVGVRVESSVDYTITEHNFPDRPYHYFTSPTTRVKSGFHSQTERVMMVTQSNFGGHMVVMWGRPTYKNYSVSLLDLGTSPAWVADAHKFEFTQIDGTTVDIYGENQIVTVPDPILYEVSRTQVHVNVFHGVRVKEASAAETMPSWVYNNISIPIVFGQPEYWTPMPFTPQWVTPAANDVNYNPDEHAPRLLHNFYNTTMAYVLESGGIVTAEATY